MTDDDRAQAAATPATGAGGDPAHPAPAPEALPAEPLPADAAPGGDETAPAAAVPAGKAKKPKRDAHWFDDLKAIFWLLLAVLAFHSCVAKPFYIPSESMMPGLLKGDRLVVSKYPYGWSWVSPSFHIFPHWQGRIWGAMPRRGDIVIVTPEGQTSDYIKRVIAVPGDTIQVIDGAVWLNGQPLRREARPRTMIPIDDNIPCGSNAPGDDDSRRFRVQGPDGRRYCAMPVFREYIPDGDSFRAYDTIDSGYSPADDYPLTRIPEGRVFLMGDNRDDSADSRVDLDHNGLGGAVPWENIGGRAEFITFSLDGSSSYWNPVSWFTALRGGRAGTSLHPTDGPPPAPATSNQGAPRQ